jgi:ATP-dependent Clp protease protease subunit
MPTRPQRFQFIAKAGAGEAELRLYGVVGGGLWTDGITSAQVAAAIDECESAGAKKLAIYINSPGGDVFEGIAILNCLKRFSGEKVVYVDGLAASIASIIAMAGDRICMGSGAMMMVHDPSAFASARGVGTAAEMRSKAEDLDKIATAMAAAYAHRTKGEESAMRTIMRAETWMTAAEAVQLGFADETFQQDEEPDASAFRDSPIFASFTNLPPALLASVKNPSGRKPDDKEHHVMKNLLAKLGLTDAATEAQALVAFEHMVGASRRLIEITGATTEGQALGTVTAWKASHDKVTEMTAKVQKIEADAAAAEVKTLADQAIKDGKATPKQRESLLLMSPETLKAFIAAAPVIAGRNHTQTEPELDSVTLTAEDREVCRKSRIDEKKFLESKKQAIAAGRAPSAATMSQLARGDI